MQSSCWHLCGQVALGGTTEFLVSIWLMSAVMDVHGNFTVVHRARAPSAKHHHIGPEWDKSESTNQQSQIENVSLPPLSRAVRCH